MVYFPVSHFPRSSVAQRSEQNGLWGFFGGFWQFGHFAGMGFSFQFALNNPADFSSCPVSASGSPTMFEYEPLIQSIHSAAMPWMA